MQEVQRTAGVGWKRYAVLAAIVVGLGLYYAATYGEPYFILRWSVVTAGALSVIYKMVTYWNV